MDIPALSMAMAQSDVRQNFSIGMLSKSLESTEVMSAEFDKVMEQPMPSDLGGSIDILA